MRLFMIGNSILKSSLKAIALLIAILCFSDSKAQKLETLFESEFRVMEMLYLTHVDNNVLFTADVIKNVNTRPMVYKYGLDKGQLSTFYQGELSGENYSPRIGYALVGLHFQGLKKDREGQIASIETGRRTSSRESINVFLKIFDDNKGTIKRELSYPDGQTPTIGKLLFTSDKGLLVAMSKTKYSYPSMLLNIDVYKFDNELNLVWKKEIPEKELSYAPISSCIETIDEGYLVSGGHVNKANGPSKGRPLFTKLSVNGEVLWSYKMSDKGIIWGGIENNNGNVFAIGTSVNKGGLFKKGGELTVTKLTSGGEPIWTYRRESNSKFDDVVTSFFIDEQTEEILILGYFANGNAYEFGLIRLDKDGNDLMKLNLDTVEKIELANYGVNYTEAQAIKTEDYILVAARIYDQAKSGSVTKLYQLKPSGEIIYEVDISGEPGTSMFPFGVVQIDDDKFVIGCWKKSKRAKRYKQSTVSLYQLNLQK